MRNFRELEIWKIGFELSIESYRLTMDFPKEEKYGLISQIRRASVSIPSNIAEGCSRSTDKDFARYLEIALGSAFELETQTLIAKHLELIPKSSLEEYLELLDKFQRKTNAFISAIR